MPTITAAHRTEVAELIFRIAAALDERRYDDLAGCFTVDGRVRTPGGEAVGRPAIAEQARRGHADYPRSQHQFSNVLVDVEGGPEGGPDGDPDGDVDRGLDGDVDGVRARLRADLVAHLVREGTVPALATGAVYRCRAVRDGGRWLFTSLEVETVWQVDAAAVGDGT